MCLFVIFIYLFAFYFICLFVFILYVFIYFVLCLKNKKLS